MTKILSFQCSRWIFLKASKRISTFIRQLFIYCKLSDSWKQRFISKRVHSCNRFLHIERKFLEAFLPHKILIGSESVTLHILFIFSHQLYGFRTKEIQHSMFYYIYWFVLCKSFCITVKKFLSYRCISFRSKWPEAI